MKEFVVDVAALIAWIVTAGGGFYLLATWITKGGMKQQASGESKFPPPVILGHFALAAAGLVVWIIYMASDTKGVAWTSFVILVLVALLGFAMLLRWIPTFQAQQKSSGSEIVAAEGHFPVAVVGVHGLLAVLTVVLVLIAAVKS